MGKQELGGEKEQQLSIRYSDQLLDIKEQIEVILDGMTVTSSDKVLIYTMIFEICRNLFTHIRSFKCNVSKVIHDDRKALLIRIVLYKSDFLKLQQNQTTMSEVLGMEIDKLRSVFDHVDASIIEGKDFSISLKKYCRNNSR